MEERRNRLRIKVGDQFNSWTIVAEAENFGKDRGRKFECKCICGSTKIVLLNSLRQGTTKSCGCLNKSKRKPFGRTYRIWKAMRARCNNPKAHIYFGKGITVCERWNDFELFLEDMGECPRNYSIDRIDSNGNYCPENCRWADSLTQNNNTSQVRLITYNGKTQSLSCWSRELGINRSTLQNRLKSETDLERVFSGNKNKRRFQKCAD